MTTSLEVQFHQAMIDAYETAKRECKYNASYFIQMVHTHGGLEAARRLLGSQRGSAVWVHGPVGVWEIGYIGRSACTAGKIQSIIY